MEKEKHYVLDELIERTVIMVKLIAEGHAQWAERYFKCNACEAEFRATPPDYDTVFVGNGENIASALS